MSIQSIDPVVLLFKLPFNYTNRARACVRACVCARAGCIKLPKNSNGFNFPT